MNNFYIYLHIKSTTGEPFYVGKGKGNRSESKIGRNKYWNNIVNKYGYDVIFLETDLTEEEAFKKEIYWIKRIGRYDLGNGPLVNMTDGGSGGATTIGMKHTQETKDKISLVHKNKIITDSFRKKCSDRMIGNKINVGRSSLVKNFGDVSGANNGNAKTIMYLDKEYKCIKDLYNEFFYDKYSYGNFTHLIRNNKINNLIKI